jgi:hypothetical protein
MSRIKKLLSSVAVLIPVGGLLYVTCLLSVMRRNVKRTDSAMFTVQNFQDSWLTALVILGIGAFAIWGCYMYDKAGEA